MSVSIIMPTYNVEAYIEHTINSVLAQTYTDFELLICLKPSNDNTEQICKSFMQKDSRIKILYVPSDKGPGVSRNIGLDNAAGDFIYFMDSDDYIDSKLLEDNVGCALKHNTDTVIFGYCAVRFDNQQRKVDEQNHYPALSGVCDFSSIIQNFDVYMDSVPYSVCTRLYKRSYIGDTRFEDRRTGEDALFNTSLLEKGITKVYFNKKLYYYYINHSSSIMGGYNSCKIENEFEVLRRNESLLNKLGILPKFEKYILKRYLESYLQEFNNYALSGCDLSDSEAGKIAKEYFNTPEILRAREVISPSLINQATARICYKLSLKGMFTTAVKFKRLYIPISFFFTRRSVDK